MSKTNTSSWKDKHYTDVAFPDKSYMEDRGDLMGIIHDLVKFLDDPFECSVAYEIWEDLIEYHKISGRKWEIIKHLLLKYETKMHPHWDKHKKENWKETFKELEEEESRIRCLIS